MRKCPGPTTEAGNKLAYIALLLVTALVFNNSVAFAAASAGTPQIAGAQGQAARVRTAVEKRGVGEMSRVKVTLNNKTQVKGYISKIDETSFGVTDIRTRQSTTIPYADVEKVGGPGLSKGAKIGIAVGVGVAVTALVIYLAACRGNSYCKL